MAPPVFASLASELVSSQTPTRKSRLNSSAIILLLRLWTTLTGFKSCGMVSRCHRSRITLRCPPLPRAQAAAPLLPQTRAHRRAQAATVLVERPPQCEILRSRTRLRNSVFSNAFLKYNHFSQFKKPKIRDCVSVAVRVPLPDCMGSWLASFRASCEAMTSRDEGFAKCRAFATNDRVLLSSRQSMAAALLERPGSQQCEPVYFSRVDMSGGRADVAFNLRTLRMTSGFGYTLRVDALQRYKYPTRMSDVKFNVSDCVIVHPHIGVVPKDGQSGRTFVPDVASRLKFMWLASCDNANAARTSHCFVCNQNDASPATLFACSFCLLTAHDECLEGMLDASRPRLKRMTRFADNMCRACRSSVRIV